MLLEKTHLLDDVVSKQSKYSDQLATQRSFPRAVREALRQKRVRTNLVIMAWLWASAYVTTDVVAAQPTLQSVSSDRYY